eukprot:1149350-Pelagomonas_calceolata.AAC.2
MPAHTLTHALFLSTRVHPTKRAEKPHMRPSAVAQKQLVCLTSSPHALSSMRPSHSSMTRPLSSRYAPLSSRQAPVRGSVVGSCTMPSASGVPHSPPAQKYMHMCMSVRCLCAFAPMHAFAPTHAPMHAICIRHAHSPPAQKYMHASMHARTHTLMNV